METVSFTAMNRAADEEDTCPDPPGQDRLQADLVRVREALADLDDASAARRISRLELLLPPTARTHAEGGDDEYVVAAQVVQDLDTQFDAAR